MRILVTAGPTREFLDDVRFLSNPSTGAMGFACAEEARRRGHRVTLIAGPTSLKPPNVRAIRVTTALEMDRAVRRAFDACDALIMTAAVSDYRPATRLRGKMKKTRASLSVRFVRNPDIVGGISRRKGDRILAGFAVESANLIRFACDKMRRKQLDFIVANPPAAFGASRVDAVLLRPDGTRVPLLRADKRRIARRVVVEIERVRDDRLQCVREGREFALRDFSRRRGAPATSASGRSAGTRAGR